MRVTRRDVLWSLGGGLAGAVFTPVPWKLLDDVSIWTQHRRALPVPSRGEVTFRPAACTLCPGGCALRVRCVGGRPVSAAGTPGHPLGAGACAIGLTLHHLARHPDRALMPSRNGAGGSRVAIAPSAGVAALGAAVAEAAKARQAVLVLDSRPGRVVSALYQELLAALPSGLYAVPADEGGMLHVLEAGLEAPQPLGFDLERARTLLSFGTPVLEGWGRPGRLQAVRGRLRVVQVDTWRSPTAAQADEWLAPRPGSEGALALGLAHVLVRDGLADAEVAAQASMLAGFAPARVAAVTGLTPSRVEELARSLVSLGPAVAVGGGDPGGGPLPLDVERAIALLNVALGSVGRAGGIVARRSVPEAPSGPRLAPTPIASVPAGSVRVLLLDGADSGRALPWALVERTLAPGALVASLSPFHSALARRANLILPSAAPLEAYDEVLPAPDAAAASFAISAPLLSAPRGAVDAADLVSGVARAAGVPLASATTHEALLKARVAAIHATGRGRLFVRRDAGYAEAAAASAGELWQGLVEGGCWIDAPCPALDARPRLPLPSAAAVSRWQQPAAAAATSVALVSFAPRAVAGSTPVSPVLSKLYQESGLRTPTTSVAMHPETARGLRLREGRRVRIESSAGATQATLRLDAMLPPDRVALPAGPDPNAARPSVAGAEGALALSVIEPDGTWCGTRVRIREA